MAAKKARALLTITLAAGLHACPTGSRLQSDGSCVPCAPGTYAPEPNSTACLACAPGALAPAQSSACRCDALADDFAADDLDLPTGACAAVSHWSAPLRLRFEKRCELHGVKLTPTCTWRVAERRALGCPCGALDGLDFKYGRSNAEDYDLYDLKPRCAGRTGQWARLLFRARERYSSASLACAAGEAVTGLRVTYARYEWGDADEYDFQLQCAGAWWTNSSALHPTRRRRPSALDTAAVECGPGMAACGLEVTRARQEDGDVDLLDFRLRCFSTGTGAAEGEASGESHDNAGVGPVRRSVDEHVEQPAARAASVGGDGQSALEGAQAGTEREAGARAAPNTEPPLSARDEL
ncbi:hypothetical protein KFE25_009536 [Diacronema lutheri]|uniref:Uncharacterized protein n=1 Tax=Diacronema lutheri TaxID=2081491 RepID=A0A8J5Y3T9_DIALT|nr:hypothetical protein KFE25_009536 [Diacronema lutheri]